MRIALAQIDPTVGDLEGNLERVRSALDWGRRRGAELVVVPELCLPGYPPRDLLDRPSFVRACEEALERLTAEITGPALLLGTITRNRAPQGKPVFNSAVLLHEGREIARRHKSLLPTYDVFDEDRHFEGAGPQEPVSWQGLELGISICEDLWNEFLHGNRRRYPRDPLAELAGAGADLIFNISASPFSLGHPRRRCDLALEQSRRLDRPLLLVNQVGGNDELIFDGTSVAVDPATGFVATGTDFEEDRILLEYDPEGGRLRLLEQASAGPDPDQGDEAVLVRALALGLADYTGKTGFSRVVLGLSGGIDSSLTAVLAARALGAENVLGVAMPSPYSSPESLEDARELASSLGMRLETVPIDGIFERLIEGLGAGFDTRRPGLAEENVQARIRAAILMAFANREHRMLLSTGNKSELAVGYCTLYGDMAGGLAVISDVPKTMVFRIARWWNEQEPVIPERVLTKPPSAELRPNQTDQDTLPPYEELDRILGAYVEEARSLEEILALGPDEETIRRMVRRIVASEYKRHQSAPGLRVTSKAFGAGRRMPIAQGFHEWERRRTEDPEGDPPC